MTLSRPPAGLRRLSQRSDVAAFQAMDVLARAAALQAEGRSVVRMEVGQPGGPAPEAARRAAQEALAAPLGYTTALGLPALRREIAALYHRRHGVELDPKRVVVTTGSSAAFQLAFLALFDVGDRLALADPGYPSYRAIAAALGLETARLAVGPAERFQPTPTLLRRAADEAPLAGVLAASPANPTGAALDRVALTALINAAHALGASFISDEIYQGLDYGAAAPSALEISDDVLIINSFSKYFAMTGWRIGWMVAPERLVRPLERLAQNLFICPPHVSQVAALAALTEDAARELDARRDVYARNRSLLLDAFPSVGLGDFAPPDGAFYLYVDTSAVAEDSAIWARALLEKGGVAATPGWDFDPVRGGGAVRFSFAGPTADVEEGVRRIARFQDWWSTQGRATLQGAAPESVAAIISGEAL